MSLAVSAQVSPLTDATTKKSCCKKSSKCTKSTVSTDQIDIEKAASMEADKEAKVASAASETIIEGIDMDASNSKTCSSECSAECCANCSKVCKKVCNALGIKCNKKE